VCPGYSKKTKTLLMKRDLIVSSIIAHEKVCKDSLSVKSFLKDREKEFCSIFDGIDLVDLYIKAFKNPSVEHDSIVAALNDAKSSIPSGYREKAYSGAEYGSLEQHSAVLAIMIISTAHVMLSIDLDDEEDVVVYEDYVFDTCAYTASRLLNEYYKKPGKSDVWLDFIFEYVQRDSFAMGSIEMCRIAVECKYCGHLYCHTCSRCPCEECECNGCDCNECLDEESEISYDEMSEEDMVENSDDSSMHSVRR
jgi:hypothetical protein